MIAHLRQFRIFALLPVTLWLLVQLSMASAATGPISSNADKTQYTQADLIEIVICTPTGFMTVKVTPYGDLHEEIESHPDCRWCQTFGKVGFLSGPVIPCVTINFETTASSWVQRVFLLPHTFDFSWARSRAPPV